jgi:hypothetical protein
VCRPSPNVLLGSVGCHMIESATTDEGYWAPLPQSHLKENETCRKFDHQCKVDIYMHCAMEDKRAKQTDWKKRTEKFKGDILKKG